MKRIFFAAFVMFFATSCNHRILNEATIIKSSVSFDTLVIPENPRGCIMTKVCMSVDLDIYYNDTISKKGFYITFYKDNRDWGSILDYYVIKLPNGLILK